MGEVKTPEELALQYQYLVLQSVEQAYVDQAFLAGYQAAKDECEAKIKELETELENWKDAAIHGDEGL